MPTPPTPNETVSRSVEAWLKHGRSRTKAAKSINIPRTTLDHHLDIAKQRNLIPNRPVVPSMLRPQRARRWILTAAQNDTAVHSRFWGNLLAYAAHIGAEILVGPFTYQLGVFTDHATRSNVFAELIRDRICFDRVECGEVLFCAEMNTLPTASRPLSGLLTYTRGRPGVFPHAKIALETTPAMPGHRPIIHMTTGCCTVENYIPKKAGLKASFHHVIGATLVEIDQRGRYFCRQLSASDDGSFQDLDCFVSNGKVSPGRRVAAITWGDIHCANIDPIIAKSAFGFDAEVWEASPTVGAALDVLRPFEQFFHDLFDGESISHWMDKQPHKKFELHKLGRLNVEEEARRVSRFLRGTQRNWCRSHVVESNHDVWIERWLQSSDPWSDMENAVAYHRWNLATLEAKRNGETNFSVFRHVLREADEHGLEGINFIPENSSYVICQDRGGVECGAHGHLGPNGSRGTSLNLSQLTMRINKGHDHKASIVDGVYSAGTISKLDLGYNKGPSSWSHSFIVTYASSKRTIITFGTDGAWRA